MYAIPRSGGDAAEGNECESGYMCFDTTVRSWKWHFLYTYTVYAGGQRMSGKGCGRRSPGFESKMKERGGGGVGMWGRGGSQYSMHGCVYFSAELERAEGERERQRKEAWHVYLLVRCFFVLRCFSFTGRPLSALLSLLLCTQYSQQSIIRILNKKNIWKKMSLWMLFFFFFFRKTLDAICAYTS